MTMSVSIWGVSLIIWAVVAARFIHTALCDASASWDLESVWPSVVIACACK